MTCLTKAWALKRIRGDFRLDSGSAYTCNLGLEGPVADIGVVGRAGIRDEDYDQLAVVRPHMSNALAVPAFYCQSWTGRRDVTDKQDFPRAVEQYW